MKSAHVSSSKAEKRADNCCISDLAINNIVVYSNKAEVTRSVKYEIFEGQVLECTFEQLPSSVEKDSIRIEVTDNFVYIHDVTFNVRPFKESSEHVARLHQIKELIQIERHTQDLMEAKISRLMKQKSVLNVFANTLIHSKCGTPDSSVHDHIKISEEKKINSISNAYNPDNLETIQKFFTLYNDSGERFDEDLLDVEEKLQQSKKTMELLESETKDIKIRQDEQLYRELIVIVEGREDGEFEMHISYVVNNCSWRPVYDVRMSNSTGSMQIYYYGVLKQKSGEDWYEPSSFSLSTAEPGVGGTVPEVGVQRVQFKPSVSVTQESSFTHVASAALYSPNTKKTVAKSASFRKSRSQSANVFDFNTVNDNITEQDGGNPVINSKITSDTNSVQQFSSMGTSFEIARPPSLVYCDNSDCRVMIAVIDLDPHYQHVTVPKYSPYAYLRSIATNSSKFTLLEGSVMIYMDSNFVGKTQISTVCPCEEFYCNLGVDKGIKINYKPMFKYRENNLKSLCVTFKQEIQVTNNHERPIKIVVVDQLPISTDEKIKVILIEPCIKNLDKYDKQKPIRINSNKQIEWDCEIGSKDKKEIVLKFSVEHPFGRDIEVMQIK